MLMCLVSLFASCVQTDMYELYDDDGTELLSPRKKGTKDIEGMAVQYTCGIHCLSYISGKSLYKVGQAAIANGIDPHNTPLTAAELIRISGSIEGGGCNFTGYVEYLVNGHDNRAAIVSLLNGWGGNKISVIVNINGHYVVGEKVDKKENKKTGEIKYYLETYDPQTGGSGYYKTNDSSIRAVIY